MFQNLTIRNFLSHKNSKFKFHRGVNVIVGETKAGKSVVIRAIDWVKDNRPTGNAFRSNWGGTTAVSLSTAQDVVKRIKSEKINEYRLNTSEPYQARTDVPDDVQKALSLNEINIETQFESHFLLSQSPGEVAKHFNKVAHLEKLDLSLSNIRKWISQINSSIASKEEEKESLQQKLTQYENLPEIEKKIEQLEKWEKQTQNLDADVDKIENLVREIKDLEAEIEKQSAILRAENKVDSAIELINKRNVLDKDIENLDSQIQDIETLEAEIENVQYIVSAREKVDEIINLVEKRDKIKDEEVRLNKLLQNIMQYQSKIKNDEKELAELENKFHEEMGETCVLCGQKIENK